MAKMTLGGKIRKGTRLELNKRVL